MKVDRAVSGVGSALRSVMIACGMALLICAPLAGQMGRIAPQASVPHRGSAGVALTDYNADGFADPVVREVRTHPTEDVVSRIVVLSGADGSVLSAFVSPEAGDAFGWSVTLVPDVDGDQIAELAVAAPEALLDPGDESGSGGRWGRVYLISPVSGALLWSADAPLTTDANAIISARALARCGDLDGDGKPEVLAAAYRFVPAPIATGPASTGESTLPELMWAAYSSRDGSLIAFESGGILGSGLPGLGGVNATVEREAWRAFEVFGERRVLPGTPGDVTGDGVVDGTDVTELLGRLHDDGLMPRRFDLNVDGHVNAGDLARLMSLIGKESPRDRDDPDARQIDEGDDASVHGSKGRRPKPPILGCDASVGPNCGGSGDGTGDGGGPNNNDDIFPNEGPGGGGPPTGCASTCDCPTAGCEASCGGGPCNAGCPTAGCNPLCDSDNDGVPNHIDCDSPCFTGPGADPCNTGCDEDGDGIPNSEECGSQCVSAEDTACACDPCCTTSPNVSVNITLDSNNDGLLNYADEAGEGRETFTRLVLANRGNHDRDDIPDYADGYGAYGTDSQPPLEGVRFAKLQFRSVAPQGTPAYFITFSYPAAPPSTITRTTIEVPDIESSYDVYERAPSDSGRLRIWKKDANEARALDDFIPSGEQIPLSSLGCDAILYIEAIHGRETPDEIVVTAHDINGQHLSTDRVRVHAFDPAVGLSSVIEEIEGYTILRNATVGTPGNDIMWAANTAAIVQAYAGDDIIIAGSADQTIYTGDGADTVYVAWAGRKQISDYFDEAAALRTRGSVSNDILPLDDQPLTTELVLRVYKLLYGENDPWLRLFTQHGGRVEAVAGDGVPFSESDWDCHTNADGFLRPVVQVQFSLDSPIAAASYARRQILDASQRSALGRCDLGYQMEAALVGQLFQAASAQEHATFEDTLQMYEHLRLAAFNNAVAATATISNIYLSSIGFFSEGADLVLTINDITEGNYASAIALLPFISAPAISGSKAVLRLGDGPSVVETVGEVVRHFPCGLRTSCGLGWIPRPNMPMRFRTPPDGGKAVVILGNGQWTNGGNGAVHAAMCESVANELADMGGFEYILMNRSLRTGTGLDILGSFSGKRPDVMGVRLGQDGRPIIFIREIQSPSQSDAVMEQNKEAIREALVGLGFDVDVNWIGLPY